MRATGAISKTHARDGIGEIYRLKCPIFGAKYTYFQLQTFGARSRHCLANKPLVQVSIRWLVFTPTTRQLPILAVIYEVIDDAWVRER